MDFADLALIALVGLAGPLLALPARWNLPVVLGQLMAGIALGDTGFRVLHPDDRTFTFLGQVGFALVMFVAGSRVPINDGNLRPALRVGVLRGVVVGVLSVGVGWAISAGFDMGHAGIYAVLIASSSAALILPIVDSVRLTGDAVLALLAQVAVADAARGATARCDGDRRRSRARRVRCGPPPAWAPPRRGTPALRDRVGVRSREEPAARDAAAARYAPARGSFATGPRPR